MSKLKQQNFQELTKQQRQAIANAVHMELIKYVIAAQTTKFIGYSESSQNCFVNECITTIDKLHKALMEQF